MRGLRGTFGVSLAGIVGACVLLGFGATSAFAAPVWNLDLHHNETHFPPGGTGQYWVEVNNVGETASSGNVNVTLHLPPGIGFLAQRSSEPLGVSWKCPGPPAAGATTIACETSEAIPRHSLSRRLIIEVSVDPSATGAGIATATLEGGGAAHAATASEPTEISSEPAHFGILPESFAMDFLQPDGLTPVRQAGAHPPLLASAFDFNSVSTSLVTSGSSAESDGIPVKQEAETVRDLNVNLPPGFVAAPTAVGECTLAQFTVSECPSSSQVGRFDASVYPTTTAVAMFNFSTGVFNLSHPRGSATDLGFVVGGNPVHVDGSLDPSDHYAIATTVSNINESLPPFNSKITIWGVPASPSHDSERCPPFSPGGTSVGGDTSAECSAGIPERPFLTVPSRCEGENVMRLSRYDSWQHPGVFGPELDRQLPGQFTGCDKLSFQPAAQLEPTGKQADSPSGLNVHIEVPQDSSPDGLGTPPVKSTVVTLPKGMSFSPSFVEGLAGCSIAQIKLGSNEPVSCPEASRIGDVSLSTPLLPKPAVGSVYLAAQGDNPFGSLFALYLVLHDTEERGILVKVPGRIDLDPNTGQITTSFNDLPQFPFESLELNFRSGSRAPLVNPPTCGTHPIGVKMTSWARPEEALDLSGTYQVAEGAGGTPCGAQGSFSPRIQAGAANPVAGGYSPFLLRLTRQDQDQELSALYLRLPEGLSAKLAGIPACPDSALAAISTALGTAAAEAASPACPAASQIGAVSAGLGAGPQLKYFPGKVYLAGPYRGAPLSLAIATPGLAGPFDLGTVVVRTALYIDPTTARVSAISDPFPTIFHGVLLHIRDIRVGVDRPETTLNPTSCEPTQVYGQVYPAGAGQANVSDRFQVGRCAALGFKPKLSFRLLGGTRRGAFPKLRATVTYPKGGAYSNIAAASVALPHSEFLEQGHIGTICTRVQFDAEKCPPDAVYGRAVARTPLFDYPLSGPVYLRSSSHELPDLVAVLKGPAYQPIEIDLDGRIDSVHGGIRNSFEVVPDAPVSSFKLELLGGKKGLLTNSRNLCKGKAARATAIFTAHNGRKITLRPAMRNSCKKRKSSHTKHAHR